MSDKLLTITIGSHFFTVTRLTDRGKEAALKFAKSYIHYGISRNPRDRKREPVAVFAAATRDREEFRFHINTLKKFKDLLQLEFIKDHLIEVVHKPIHEGKDVTIKIKPEWVLRANQVPVVDYITNKEGPVSCFVGAATGFGKGICSLTGTSILGKRTVVIIRPMYIYKWIDDLLRYTELSIEEIMVVQGTKELQALLMLAESDQLDSISVIIISNKTLQSYISKYELHRQGILDMGYTCVPEDMFELLEAGVRLIDEVHLDFHLNFKIDLYTNIPKSISLSATLLNNNGFLESMYDVAYPLHQRYGNIGLDKYISARAVIYRLADSKRMRTSEYGSDTYSHNAFEVSIMKNYSAMSNYLRLLKVVADAGFIRDYKPTEKMIIYCYRGDFCTKVVQYLKLVYPSLDIRRYISEDPPENMYEPDIRVTTLGSGSTAHDISNLKVAILTVAVDSIQSNIQALGRLRKLETAQTRFYYYVCENIQKHVQYHESKRKMLEQRAMSFDIIRAPFDI